MNEQLIFIGGVFNFGFAVFHLLFWKLFDWKTELASLNFINRNVMQIMNLCLTLVFFIFAYISIFHTSELLSTGLGFTLILSISIFWFLRAIEQVIFFRLSKPISWVLFILFLIGGLLYGVPALNFA